MDNQTTSNLSLGQNLWNIAEINERCAELLCQQENISASLAKLLILRKIPSNAITGFLNPKLATLTPDPSILKDMDKAAERIAEAVINHQKIAIIGDYDVDGATSTSVMRLFLTYLGVSTAVHIPEREEGYGPSDLAFQEFSDFGANLVLTVDCGTSAFEVLNRAAQNFDIIVIDHHEAETKLPDVYAVVNPKRLDQSDERPDLAYMAAVGVVFMTIIAVNRALRQKGFYTKDLPEPKLMQWLDLVALGTVCDVVPLLGLNRAFVTQGLKIMAERKNLGLKTLIDAANISEKPDAYHLGFVLGPRINACGRVGKASIGSRLLCSSNPIEALHLAEEMNTYNQERKDIECFVLEKAVEMLEGSPQTYPMAFVASSGWHQGVIGIVAGRLKERYNLPSFVMSIEEDEVKGSARSIEGVDLGALIIAAKEKGVITKGGGHTMAAGFSLTEEQIPAFRQFAGEYIAKSLNNTKPYPILNIDLSLSLSAANNNLCEELERLKPFGTGNPEPLILLRDVYFQKPYIIGSGHIKCELTNLSSNARLTAIAFKAADTELGNEILSRHHNCYDVVGNLRFNRWNNSTSLQFIITDIKRTQ
ncbi:MAG: single-stranded-DNA-specific exonuclease RecJ [Alphaproteobacteria bacterium]|nr:single-stranded-DNA-specific exonuclease RecJ [Alphaproteobacteria bacterium]MBP3688113.1 single-stranded-DNA-specific exonuclease RecJ [Alphaproteobacteria bacterium]